MVSDGKRTLAVIGDRVNHFIPNPTFDPIIVPGCLDLLFRGEIPEGVDPASLMKVERMAEHPEYQNRDARIAVMDTQDIETVFMLPTFACGVEEALKHDIDATMASVHAFNLWLDEDWGFDRPDHRIIAAPIISLADPVKAVEEVEFVLGRGAKLVLVRPGAGARVWSSRGRWAIRSHDPVWARLAEAGVPVDSTSATAATCTSRRCGAARRRSRASAAKDPLDQILLDDRAIHDTMASMIVHGVFTRHPKLKAASIENGSYFVHRLIKRLKKAANTQPRDSPRTRWSSCATTCGSLPTTRTIAGAGRGHRRRQDPVRLGLAARRGSGVAGVVHRGTDRISANPISEDHARQRFRSPRRQSRRGLRSGHERMDHRRGSRRHRRCHSRPADDRVRKPPQHLRRVGRPNPPAGELPGRQGIRRPSRARDARALGMRPGSGRADHAQRSLPRHGDRLPQGAHRPGQRQPPLLAARDRATCSTTCDPAASSITARWAPSSPMCCRPTAPTCWCPSTTAATPPQLPGAVSLDDALATGRSDQACAESPDDLIMICTGGTTGRPKGVLWRQSDMYVSSMVGADHTSVTEIHDKVASRRPAVVRGLAADARRRDVDRVRGAHAPALPVVLYDDRSKLDAAVGVGDRRAREGRHDDDGRRRLRRTADRRTAARIDYDLSSLYAIGTGGAATNPKYKRALMELPAAHHASSTATARRKPATWASGTASGGHASQTLSPR